MEQSSQGQSRRARRPWTNEDQRRAEELRAQGLSYEVIGRQLGRASTTVRYRLDPDKGRESKRQWREANRDRDRQNKRRWREANLERCRELARICDRRWRAANPEKCREQARARDRRWRAANPDRALEAKRRWRKANPEKRMRIELRWCQSHPEKVRAKHRRRHALKRQAGQRALIAVTDQQLAYRFDLFGCRCAYCGSASSVTADHVLALAAGGLDEASNIVPACRSCNSSKRDRAVEPWYRRQPFFSEARWQRIRRHCPGADTGQLPLALSAAA